MSAPKQTPEPRFYRAEIEDNDLVITPIDGPLVRIPIRRIRACVNACRGISTEALEAGALVNLRGLAERIAEYWHYREDDERPLRKVVADIEADARAALAKLEDR